MSHQHWELLAKITTGQVTELATVCQGLAREADAERLFCVVSTPRGDQVLAIDCDGYPLGYAAERLADGGLSDLVFRFNASATSFEPLVVRRVSRASKRTVIVGKMRVAAQLGVTLILENRFAGEGLANFDDAQVVRWLVILGLVARLNATGEHSAESVHSTFEPGFGRRSDDFENVSVKVPDSAEPTHSERVEPSPSQPTPEPEPEERQRADTLGALSQEHWNISRAARRLGMTRHGLKKRMRRLSLAKA